MKKVFCIFLSSIILMGLGSCKKGHSVLTFVSSGESTISLDKEGEPSDISLEYSIDGKNWKPYTIGETLILADGRELSFRAGEQGNDCFSYNDEDYYYFEISGRVAAKGNIMSLLDRKCSRNSVPSAAFYNLFKDCQSLTLAPELPATELAKECYEDMFASCTRLTEAPALPATKLAAGCYAGMFAGCESLTKAPELPATKLAEWCYSSMFEGCASLTDASFLPAMVLAESCYFCMFSGCTSLTKAPKLPAMKLAKSCYAWMFEGCESLTTAPILPATELAEICYGYMFLGCTILNKAPALLATELTKSCYEGMFKDCTNLNYIKAFFTDGPSDETTHYWLSSVSSTGTFVKSKDATWGVRGDSGIPYGWNVEIE